MWGCTAACTAILAVPESAVRICRSRSTLQVPPSRTRLGKADGDLWALAPGPSVCESSPAQTVNRHGHMMLSECAMQAVLDRSHILRFRTPSGTFRQGPQLASDQRSHDAKRCHGQSLATAVCVTGTGGLRTITVAHRPLARLIGQFHANRIGAWWQRLLSD